ncbi:hypothetical protein CHS0354_002086 [Potamilus streckersoni]|uniref:Prokaryotic-type class I peptide chain release factors domain-containing protein n=1 Tax=Potamilus streckersoni TaxID=2493646 RepID=A0AAE0T6B3_9BIVA|nr:hypothetical protein CHS0354_002086 [Potamilus streckersoni]
MRKISETRTVLEKWKKLVGLEGDIASALEILELGEDADIERELQKNLTVFRDNIAFIELSYILGGENDFGDAIVHINSGAGGTESMDWAGMLFRMLKRSIRVRQTEIRSRCTPAGQNSPFDSNKRRHTSFASVFVYPDVEDDVNIEINESDLRIDTYRSSGAGGQHVNTTDSAVRITHIPTGIVVQCQNERSQHKNRDKAMKVLKSALYQHRMDELQAEQEKLNSEKKEIGWGSQIRSYVLHPYKLVKDHRTGYETSNTQRVLDGEIDDFIDVQLRKKTFTGTAVEDDLA